MINIFYISFGRVFHSLSNFFFRFKEVRYNLIFTLNTFVSDERLIFASFQMSYLTNEQAFIIFNVKTRLAKLCLDKKHLNANSRQTLNCDLSFATKKRKYGIN